MNISGYPLLYFGNSGGRVCNSFRILWLSNVFCFINEFYSVEIGAVNVLLIGYLYCAFFSRILAFICMVLVLWSPVIVPLLPTLVQSWTTNNSSRIAELVCIFGLYTAVVILVMLWGKRIRGYENPFEEYGLALTSLQEVWNSASFAPQR